VRDGNNAAAMQRLDEEIRTRAVTPEVHELYRRLLRSSADAAAIEKHAALYLNLLMLEKQERKALGLLRESLTANPDFVPLQVEHGDQLAQRARTLGQAQLALDQWQALLRRHPKDGAAPRWGAGCRTDDGGTIRSRCRGPHPARIGAVALRGTGLARKN
jgi:tetratricopeptide (TPR) repeat protein